MPNLRLLQLGADCPRRISIWGVTIVVIAYLLGSIVLGAEPIVRSLAAEKGCYYDAHFSAPFDLWDLPGQSRDAVAQRFSPTGRDSLMEVIFWVMDVGGFGNDTIIIQIFADNDGLPADPSLAEVRLDPYTYPPDLNVVDLSYLGLVFDTDFHISFTSSGTVGVDAEWWESDDGTMGQYRTSVLWEGVWIHTEEFYGMGYNIISEVYLCDADFEPELYISHDSIGANHEGFEAAQMEFYVANDGPGDVYFDVVVYADDQYYWVDPVSAEAGPYGSDTITVTLNYAAMPCPQTEGIHEFFVLIIYDDPPVFDTVWVSDTVWHDDNVWINITDPVPYQRKSAASPATGHITRNYYSGYQCFGFVQGWWSIDQGGSWNPVDHNLDEYTFTWTSPDTTLLDMWLRFEIEDMGHTDTDTVKNVIVFQPDSQPPDVNWTYPNPADHFVRGDDVVLKWSATDDHLLAHDSIFYSVSGAVPDWQFIGWHYGYRDSIQWVVPDTVSDSVLFKILVHDAAGNSLAKVTEAYSTIGDSLFLTVTRPLPCEHLFTSYPYHIEWEKDAGIDQVDIEFSGDNGGLWESIATGVSGTSYDWTIDADPTAWGLIRIVDANDPGNSDVTDGTIFINGEMFFEGWNTFDSSVKPSKTVGGDFDAVVLKGSEKYPGIDDIARVQDGNVHINLATGWGGYWPKDTFVIDRPAVAGPIVTDDFDEDGHLDLAIGYPSEECIYLHFGIGHGAFTVEVGSRRIDLEGNPSSIELLDANQDGNVDLCVGFFGSYGTAVWYGDGTRSWEGRDPVVFPQPSSPPRQVLPALNLRPPDKGGTFPDLVAVLDDGRIGSFENLDGTDFGPFQVMATLDGTPGPIQAFDVNGDGLTDLGIGHDDSTETFSLLINDGAGGFSVQEYPTLAPDLSSAAAADFNGDGCLDIILGSRSTDRLVILAGIPSECGGRLPLDSAAYFSYPALIETGDEPVDILVTDSDADGRPDLIVTNYGSENLWIFEGAIDSGAATSLDIVYPDGFDSLFEDEETQVVWTKDDGIVAVDLQISRDSGISWEPIASNLYDTSFGWMVTAPGTDSALVRVKDHYVPGRVGMSDNPFVIVSLSCCETRADINHDGTGPDIADLVYLVNYMFNGGPEPPCNDDGYFVEADVNGDMTGPDIADLVYIVNYMFNGGPAPVPCP